MEEICGEKVTANAHPPLIGPPLPKGTSPAIEAWVRRVRASPGHGSDLWLPVQPDLRPLNAAKDLYEVYSFFSIELPPVHAVTSGKALLLHPHFQTDGASLPRCLWPWLGSPFDPEFVVAAGGVHDPCYQAEYFTRRINDLMLYWVMVANGADLDKCRRFWLGVRAGGWYTYAHDHTTESIAMARSQVEIIPCSNGHLDGQG